MEEISMNEEQSEPEDVEADEITEVLGDVPTAIEEAELLMFLLDGSGSMAETTTHDGRQKVEHLMEVMSALLDRLKRGTAAARFRAQAIYFAAQPIPMPKYHMLNEFVVENPVEKTGGGSTAIAKTLDTTGSLLDSFESDETLPDDKYATVFLVTDGQENMGGDVPKASSKLKGHLIAPIIATVGIGADADESLLLETASETSERQLRHLGDYGLLKYMPDQSKLYLRAHEAGRITEDTAEALRRFVYVLSATKKGAE